MHTPRHLGNAPEERPLRIAENERAIRDGKTHEEAGEGRPI